MVLKILSARITHKSDVGGVAVDLTAERVGARLVAMAERGRGEGRCAPAAVPGAGDGQRGTELILGMHRDPLGTAILLGMGGVTAELFKDTTMRLLRPTAGLTPREALGMASESEDMAAARWLPRPSEDVDAPRWPEQWWRSGHGGATRR